METESDITPLDAAMNAAVAWLEEDGKRGEAAKRARAPMFVDCTRLLAKLVSAVDTAREEVDRRISEMEARVVAAESASKEDPAAVEDEFTLFAYFGDQPPHDKARGRAAVRCVQGVAREMGFPFSTAWRAWVDLGPDADEALLIDEIRRRSR